MFKSGLAHSMVKKLYWNYKRALASDFQG
jgi:hypothetical protein